MPAIGTRFTEQLPDVRVHFVGLKPEVLENVTEPVGVLAELKRSVTTAVQVVV